MQNTQSQSLNTKQLTMHYMGVKVISAYKTENRSFQYIQWLKIMIISMYYITIQEVRGVCSTLRFVMGQHLYLFSQLHLYEIKPLLSYACEHQTRLFKQLQFSVIDIWCHVLYLVKTGCYLFIYLALTCLPLGNNLRKSLLLLFRHWKCFLYI